LRSKVGETAREEAASETIPISMVLEDTFVQPFGDALNLNVHSHTLVLDGVYVREESGRIRFHRLPPPDAAEVARVTARIARRVAQLLERRGLGPAADPEEADPLRRDQPLLAELYSASVHGRVADGPRAGQRVMTVGEPIDAEAASVIAGRPCAAVSGFSLHAGVCIPAHAPRPLERLCRYVARPPTATERLSRLADGRLLYRLRHRWRDGTTHVVFEPLEFVQKLAALVPPPRFNLIRYHGVLAPAARWRCEIIPKESQNRTAESASHAPCAATSNDMRTARRCQPKQSIPSHPRHYCWAELMRRVWELDVLECPRCFGRMRIVAAVHSSEGIRKILGCLGLPSRAPPIGPASEDRTIGEDVTL
jgi:hypothetical protein